MGISLQNIVCLQENISMAAPEVKVLGSWASPFVMRARIALALKSINYELFEENLLESKSQLLLKSNPVFKKIPVLLHADRLICESLNIVQYIDETWSSSPSILPSDPYERANSRFWAAYVDYKWFPALIGIFVAEGEEAKNAAIGQVEEGLVLLEEAFGKLSKGKAFFGGNQIGYIDITLGCFLVYVQLVEESSKMKVFTQDRTPLLLQWAYRFSSHDVVKDVMPQLDKLREFILKLIPKYKEAVIKKGYLKPRL